MAPKIDDVKKVAMLLEGKKNPTNDKPFECFFYPMNGWMDGWTQRYSKVESTFNS